MRYLSLFLLGLFLLQAVTAQECIASGAGSVEGPQVDYPDLPPDHVLYIIVGQDYYYDMYNGYTKLQPVLTDQAYCKTGCTMTFHHLSATAAAVPNLDSFTQIWVGDLSAQPDLGVNQRASYQRIAQWWRNRGEPHIILDGRYLSSLWSSGHVHRPNGRIIRNYFVNLRARGGGLMLGTDHAPAFVSGINEINAAIGVGPFINFYYESPYMDIDLESPLMNFPASCWCTDHGNYIWDDSSTSDVPYNLQANGHIIYPVGWHANRGFGRPGLGTTIRGTIGFLINMDSPQCHASFAKGQTVSFSASFIQDGNPNFSATWKSDRDGTLFTVASIATSAGLSFTSSSLSVGAHTITLTVTDSQRLTARAKATILITPVDDEPEGPVVIANGQVRRIYPIRRQMSVQNYYGYGNNPAAATSASTPDSLENQHPATGQFFLYDDGQDGLYAVHLFGSAVDNANMRSDFTIALGNLQGKAGTIVVRDDPTYTQFSWNSATGVGSASMQWNGQTTGFVAGPLPYNEDFSLKYQFNKQNEAGIKNFAVRSHSEPSFALPNPTPIITHAFPANTLNTLEIVYRQLKCSDTVSGFNTYTQPWGRVTNSIVKFGWNVVAADYHYPDTDCKWLIQPGYPIYGVAFYKQGDFLQQSGDEVVFHRGTAFNSIALTYTSNGVQMPNSFEILMPDGVAAVGVHHNPNNDMSTAAGFYATYSVIPGLLSISPSDGAYQQSTPITVTGYAVYNNQGLNQISCRIGTTVVPATFVSASTVKCVVPASTADGVVTVAISNDGLAWSNTTTFTYFTGGCDELLSCGACLPVTGCNWCNRVSQCFAVSDPAAPECTGEVDSTCCSACQQNEGCNGHGTCACQDFCECSTTPSAEAPLGWQNEDCSCKVCPTNAETGEQCGGSTEEGDIGSCTCEGTCECAFGHTGDACECLTCPGFPLACNGHGTCQCDGTCLCDEEWTSSTDPGTCDCALECPTADTELVCSGHGECLCGVCTCDAGYGVLDDCSCLERCEDDCSGQGSCNCDGTCSCLPGYSGETCATFNPCDFDDCTNCTLNNDCAWCVETAVCQNIYLPPELTKCYIVAEERPGNLTTECPIAVVPGVPPVVDNTAIIAASAVGGVAVAAAAAAIAAWLYKKKSTGFLSSGENPFEASDDGTMANPLYEMGNSGDNPLYNTGAQQ